MLPLTRRLREEYFLDDDDSHWLAGLVQGWHLLADISFADLILWVPNPNGEYLDAIEQIRTMTGPTSLEEDMVGNHIAADGDRAAALAYSCGKVIETSITSVLADIPVAQCAVPVFRGQRCIAVIECHHNQWGSRSRGASEEAYQRVAACFKTMINQGRFPVDPPGDPLLTPRVGHGILVINQDGIVSYASPNSIYAMRSLGVTADLLGAQVQDCLPAWMGDYSGLQNRLQVEGRASEFTMSNDHASVRLRVLPMWDGDEPHGMLVISRDTSQRLISERELDHKNAAIREIHHRVKNNLQTIAALLRMQARRLGSQDGKDALGDAQRRVQTIASVHEILSRSARDDVLFDVIADRILRSAQPCEAAAALTREGSFRFVPAQVATPLALILAELCQNAVEHGAGSVPGTLVVQRIENGVRMTLTDSGPGLPEDFDIDSAGGLGLSIVDALTNDLNGRFTLANNTEGCGACANVCIDWWAHDDAGMLDD